MIVCSVDYKLSSRSNQINDTLDVIIGNLCTSTDAQNDHCCLTLNIQKVVSIQMFHQTEVNPVEDFISAGPDILLGL